MGKFDQVPQKIAHDIIDMIQVVLVVFKYLNISITRQNSASYLQNSIYHFQMLIITS